MGRTVEWDNLGKKEYTFFETDFRQKIMTKLNHLYRSGKIDSSESNIIAVLYDLHKEFPPLSEIVEEEGFDLMVDSYGERGSYMLWQYQKQKVILSQTPGTDEKFTDIESQILNEVAQYKTPKLNATYKKKVDFGILRANYAYSLEINRESQFCFSFTKTL